MSWPVRHTQKAGPPVEGTFWESYGFPDKKGKIQLTRPSFISLHFVIVRKQHTPRVEEQEAGRRFRSLVLRPTLSFASDNSLLNLLLLRKVKPNLANPLWLCLR